MPTKYTDRLNIPEGGDPAMRLTTRNGLDIARGYRRVVFSQKGPLLEIDLDQMRLENIDVPKTQVWRLVNTRAEHIEYRSKDYCKVKIIVPRRPAGDMTPNLFYISPFDLTSDRCPVLIQPLKRGRKYA